MRYNRPKRNKFRSNDRGFRRNDSQDLRIHGINSTSKNFSKKQFFWSEMVLKPKNY